MVLNKIPTFDEVKNWVNNNANVPNSDNAEKYSNLAPSDGSNGEYLSTDGTNVSWNSVNYPTVYRSKTEPESPNNGDVWFSVGDLELRKKWEQDINKTITELTVVDGVVLCNGSSDKGIVFKDQTPLSYQYPGFEVGGIFENDVAYGGNVTNEFFGVNVNTEENVVTDASIKAGFGFAKYNNYLYVYGGDRTSDDKLIKVDLDTQSSTTVLNSVMGFSSGADKGYHQIGNYLHLGELDTLVTVDLTNETYSIHSASITTLGGTKDHPASYNGSDVYIYSKDGTTTEHTITSLGWSPSKISKSSTETNLYVANETNIARINAETGTVVWNRSKPNQYISSLLVEQGNLLLGSDNIKVYDSATGDQIESSPLKVVSDYSTVLAFDQSNGEIYVSTRGNNAEISTKIHKYTYRVESQGVKVYDNGKWINHNHL